MKTLFHLAWIRLSEQPVKMLYLTITLAAGVLAWLVLSAFTSPRLLSQTGDALKARVSISNARVKFGGYPVRYTTRIRQIPGVGGLSWLHIAGYDCDNKARGEWQTVTGLGGDVGLMLQDRGISEADFSAWLNTENGILVGAEAKNRCGLNPGVTVSPLINNQEVPLHVIAILPEIQTGRVDKLVLAHYEYLNRFQPDERQDKIVSVTVHVGNPAMLDQVATAIEREFESSDPPLEAEVHSLNSILGRFGQAQWLLLLVTGAMALCVFLVFCAVLMHLTGQRRTSMAVLQTLGFTARIQFFALLLEISSVILLGAMLGIAAGHGILSVLNPWAADTLLGSNLRPVDGTVLILLPAGLLLLAIALIWPATQIAKLKPIDHLRL